MLSLTIIVTRGTMCDMRTTFTAPQFQSEYERAYANVKTKVKQRRYAQITPADVAILKRENPWLGDVIERRCIKEGHWAEYIGRMTDAEFLQSGGREEARNLWTRQHELDLLADRRRR